MKKIGGLILSLFAFLSCEPVHHVQRGNSKPTVTSKPNKPSHTSSEDSYEELIKTYEPETADVLNDLLNSDYDSKRTSLIIDNRTNCNFVINIKGGGLNKKIPITKGKLGHVMVNRNSQYSITGNVCGKNYKSSKYISDSYTIILK